MKTLMQPDFTVLQSSRMDINEGRILIESDTLSKKGVVWQ